MSTYFISYDLRNKSDYQKLYDELEDLSAIRILESMWCIKHDNTDSAAIRDHLADYIDNDDGLMVSCVTGWASRKTDGTPKDL